jgi:predicted RNA polymerase sigma factor
MPEARFKVLSRAEAEEVTRALSESKASHLARGVIYTRAGLLAEAEQEFEALLKLNPQSRVARKLLNDVRAMRRAG